MRLKVRDWIEMTFKKLVPRCSGGKYSIESLLEAYCRLGPCLATTRFKEVTPKRAQPWSGGELRHFPSRRPNGKSMAGI